MAQPRQPAVVQRPRTSVRHLDHRPFCTEARTICLAAEVVNVRNSASAVRAGQRPSDSGESLSDPLSEPTQPRHRFIGEDQAHVG